MDDKRPSGWIGPLPPTVSEARPQVPAPGPQRVVVTLGDEERRRLIQAEIAVTVERMQRAAEMHFATLYDELVGRKAALEWCLGIEEVTMVGLVRR